MSGLSKREYVNTRARFQRMQDGKFMSGWVIDFTYPHLLVRAATDVAMNANDTFAFHLVGSRSDCKFVAKFKGIDDLDVLKNSSLSFLEGSNVQMMSVHESTFEFEVISQPQFSDSVESGRKCVLTLEAKFDHEDTQHSVQILDISRDGCALASPIKIASGTEVNLAIIVQKRELTIPCEVRSCRKVSGTSMYRVGCKLRPMPRIELVSWHSLMEAE